MAFFGVQYYLQQDIMSDQPKLLPNQGCNIPLRASPNQFVECFSGGVLSYHYSGYLCFHCAASLPTQVPTQDLLGISNRQILTHILIWFLMALIIMKLNHYLQPWALFYNVICRQVFLNTSLISSVETVLELTSLC